MFLYKLGKFFIWSGYIVGAIFLGGILFFAIIEPYELGYLPAGFWIVWIIVLIKCVIAILLGRSFVKHPNQL